MQVARQGTTYFVLVSSSEDGPVMVAMKIALAQQSPTNVLVKCYQCAMIILIPICEKIFICVYLPLSADKINFSAQTFAYFKKILYLCRRFTKYQQLRHYFRNETADILYDLFDLLDRGRQGVSTCALTVIRWCALHFF